MSLFAFLTRQHRRRRQPQPNRFRPRLEVLEGRALPSTLFVTNNSDTGVSGDGSLRGEIAAAASGDTIDFARSVQGQTITLTGGELGLSKSLVIENLLARPVTISGNSGNNASRVFDINNSSATVTLSGLTITNGFSSGPNVYGGGINNSGTLTVSRSTLSSNSAVSDPNDPISGSGGGIINFGTLTVSQSTLSGNSASEAGGGIFNFSLGTLTVSQSTLSGNSAFAGGGIFNLSFGTLTVSQSTLSGNSATVGGGIANFIGGTVTVSQSTLSGNSAAIGGGIANAGALTVMDSTFSMNAGGNIIGSSFIDGGGNTFR